MGRMDTPLYRGRFAPSPTGPLHFGSLVAAVGSFLDARAHGGEWLVRIDDLDLPRCVPGMADDILRILEAFGLEWDGAVVYQSHRSEYYRAALAELEHLGAVYPCACTRREIADSALGPDGAAIYPGTCRGGLAPGRSARAIRLRVDEGEVGFQDELQGWIGQHLANEVGDFVIRRADGLFAYQLATVVDDAEQGVTCVVRGSDLIDSTPRQIALQRLLELPVPAYAHLPVAVNAQGEKLSKQTLAPPVSADKPVLVLRNVLRFLGQELPKEAQDADLAALWRLAASHWRRTAIPPLKSIILK